jgi:hypothetical protein
VHKDNWISEALDPALIADQGAVRYVSVRMAVALFVAGALLISGVAIAVHASALTGLYIYAAIAAPLFLAAILSRMRQLSQGVERTVEFDGVNVTVATSEKTESHPLVSCCWFRGKATDDGDLNYQPIRRKAIVIVFPTGRTVACGFDVSSHAQWLDLLRSSGCRRVLRQEGALGVLFFVLTVFGLVGGGFAGWELGRAVGNGLLPNRANNDFVNAIAAALAILLAWGGAVLPWFIPGWRRHTEQERQQFHRFAILFPLKIAIPAGLVLGANWLAGLALAAAFCVLFLVLSRRVIHASAEHPADGSRPFSRFARGRQEGEAEVPPTGIEPVTYGLGNRRSIP